MAVPASRGRRKEDDIDTYRTFLPNLGKLGIPLANYDFHPANTFTTATVQRRGYTVREFNLNDFRTRIEKPGAKIEPVEIREVVRLFAGQGTINVNSWSPDSKRFADVSYAVE